MEKAMDEKIIMNYEVVELLHKSSSWGNIVFKVKPQNKEKLYVLKCFPKIENGLQKLIFKREIEALRTLNVCDGIVKLRDSSTELYPFKGNECYGGILMDYVPGETLDHINWNRCTQLKKYEICLQILQAVNNAHSNNVIHRDLKPSNIIYDKCADKELLTIDGIESVYVVFIKIPLQVFVSTNGWDIDITATKKKYSEILLEYKDEIIRQINNKKVLRTHWKRKTVQDEPYNGACLEEVDDLVDLIKNADYKKNKEQKEIEELQMKMFSSRKLLNGEVKVLLDYLASNAQQVEMSIDNIDDWAYDKNFVGKLSHYVGKADLKIKYQDSNNIEKAIDRIERGHNVTEYKKCRHGYFLCWKYDEKYEVYGIPIEREVINKDTSCIMMNYYLQRLEKNNV